MSPAPAAPVCPACGRALQPVVLDANTAPWLCKSCGRGWWQVEVNARAEFDTATRDFGDATHALTAEAYAERAVAALRGTSVLPDMLSQLPDDVLTALLARTGISVDLIKAVKAEQARRKKPAKAAG